MEVSRKSQWITFVTWNSLAILAIILFPIYLKLIDYFPVGTCSMVQILHLYCPACGMTRATKYLLEFNIIKSIWCNPFIFGGVVLFGVYDIAMIKYLIKGTERDYLVKTWMVWTVFGLLMAFFVVRNILLVCGFDMLGDIVL